MSRGSLVRALGAVRRSAGRPNDGEGVHRALGKDFSAVPVCGAVRPLADQRARRHSAG